MSGVQVSAIGLGAMPLSLAGRPDEATAIKVIHAALDAGMTLIDTADVYCLDDGDLGHNERLIARALRDWPRRAEVLVATKGGMERPDGTWTVNAQPEHLRAACERSLRALGVEAIGLYQLHAPDPTVPFEESVGALAELQRQGKVLHVGLSNVAVPAIDLARTVVQVASVQNRCTRSSAAPSSTARWPTARGTRSPSCPTAPSAGTAATRALPRTATCGRSPGGSARRRTRSRWPGCSPRRR